MNRRTSMKLSLAGLLAWVGRGFASGEKRTRQWVPVLQFRVPSSNGNIYPQGAFRARGNLPAPIEEYNYQRDKPSGIIIGHVHGWGIHDGWLWVLTDFPAVSRGPDGREYLLNTNISAYAKRRADNSGYDVEEIHELLGLHRSPVGESSWPNRPNPVGDIK